MPRRIAILIPFIGEFPWYFNFFVHSSRYNPSFHFYIISDQKCPFAHIPANIVFVPTTFDQLKSDIERKLSISCAFTDSYKLCDFRPAFGIIFSEMLKGYDFWGYADIDIILGNVREFISDEILEDYDVISLRHDYLLGCFSLFKNIPAVNSLFTYSKDYAKVFASDRHFCFDETNFHFNEFSQDIHYSDIESEIESMTHVVKKMHEKKYINAYFDFHVIEGLPGKLKWENGRLTYKNNIEVALYHLIQFKKIYYLNRLNFKIPNKFYISTQKIYFRYDHMGTEKAHAGAG